MAKIKHTKNELKAQREALARFEHYLPMLQLKKQQLQAEILRIDGEINTRRAEEDRIHAGLEAWRRLFSEPPERDALGVDDLVSLTEAVTGTGNIAGVNIPVLEDVKISRQELDLFATPTWYDDAVEVLAELIRLRVERDVFGTQRRLIADELRITTQRVNLFEKVKIPECRENIRVIKIFLGDEQTAAVARAKIAKSRLVAYEYEDEAA
jgi:V/A-type H+-transporting ATPase subunit D